MSHIDSYAKQNLLWQENGTFLLSHWPSRFLDRPL